MNGNIYIIGAGGVGSWLTPSLCLLTKPSQVIVVDGDKLEKGNLNRQLFDPSDIGRYKAEALADAYGCGALNEWFGFGLLSLTRHDWLICCADNHPSRNAVLQTCDSEGCKAITACNETHSSEAFYYQPDWHGGPLDPRIYYPTIATNHDGDPRAGAIGCTGAAQEANRQLVSANFNAAALAQNLFVLWAMEAPSLKKETIRHLPYHYRQSLSQNEFIRVCDRLETPKTSRKKARKS